MAYTTACLGSIAKQCHFYCFIAGGCNGYSTGAMEPEVFVVSTGFDGFVKISDRHGRLQASLRPQYHQACCVRCEELDVCTGV